MAKLVITLEVDADPILNDPNEVAEQLLDMLDAVDQNHPYPAKFILADWRI